MPMAARSQQRMTCSLLRSPLRGYDSNGAKSNAKGRRLVSLAVSVPAGMPISIPDDRTVSGVGLKPTLEFELLRSEILTARGYPEVDGDGPEVHPAIMYDFIGASNQTLQGSTETPRARSEAKLYP